MNKYHNIKVYRKGVKYDSKKEAKRGFELELLEKANLISELERQKKFELQPSYQYNGETIRAINYYADFTYKEDGKLIVEDTKGFRTKEYLIKKKLLLYKYDIDFREIT